ncbi:hypothetical protein AVEN_224332-1 [Araneus ventricosus]|uniref:Uncharacterized protein n=1 Tax=Araneus ventricosus TaxID=182803 RepID=A0A4Y2VMM9_ARAVE|nr:hypothetical protein AVEN_224332-1 [Araneus ventricosus]
MRSSETLDRTPPHVPVPKKDANSTRCSQVVTLPSTDHARCCLTAVIRREPVLSAWYGHWTVGYKGFEWKATSFVIKTLMSSKIDSNTYIVKVAGSNKKQMSTIHNYHDDRQSSYFIRCVINF